MIRFLFLMFAVCCGAIVAVEGAALAWLASQGRLNGDTLRDAKEAFVGKPPASTREVPAQETHEPVVNEVMQKRVTRLFDLGRREDELQILKNLVAEQAKRVTAMQDQLEKKQQDFEKRLNELREQNEQASIQQSRTVLQAMQPAEAADQLMSLSPEQSLTVLRGMPEKTIARILKELTRNADKKVSERGQKLFESLTEGEPERSLIRSAGADGAGEAPPG
ncbi:MAG: hypothetical protein IT428_13095 [Planctomycetaceae bacterium]|nr:hypothetical protein [Planctomycetaceae bacterium]